MEDLFPDLTSWDIPNVDKILKESGTPVLIEIGFPSSLIRLDSESV